MNKEQYLKQRGELLNAAKSYIADGKLDDAKAKREEIAAIGQRFSHRH